MAAEMIEIPKKRGRPKKAEASPSIEIKMPKPTPKKAPVKPTIESKKTTTPKIKTKEVKITKPPPKSISPTPKPTTTPKPTPSPSTPKKPGPPAINSITTTPQPPPKPTHKSSPPPIFPTPSPPSHLVRPLYLSLPRSLPTLHANMSTSSTPPSKPTPKPHPDPRQPITLRTLNATAVDTSKHQLRNVLSATGLKVPSTPGVGRAHPGYNRALWRWTTIIASIPLFLASSWWLYERVELGKMQKEHPAVRAARAQAAAEEAERKGGSESAG
ncbi:hypothetical protein BT63DRAFT_429156 [Microthyrium microscopicum]|uniref:Uncharacterized protein n=1 Tax=Microthyrium microscopicum TaxID=703497 RepID=A0A6A6TZH5_9PEZI|nr:hypothetical protein BT63DRAFT_429156 [Microthyrium microscopicum]